MYTILAPGGATLPSLNCRAQSDMIRPRAAGRFQAQAQQLLMRSRLRLALCSSSNHPTDTETFTAQACDRMLRPTEDAIWSGTCTIRRDVGMKREMPVRSSFAGEVSANAPPAPARSPWPCQIYGKCHEQVPSHCSVIFNVTPTQISLSLNACRLTSAL